MTDVGVENLRTLNTISSHRELLNDNNVNNQADDVLHRVLTHDFNNNGNLFDKSLVLKLPGENTEAQIL